MEEAALSEAEALLVVVAPLRLNVHFGMSLARALGMRARSGTRSVGDSSEKDVDSCMGACRGKGGPRVAADN